MSTHRYAVPLEQTQWHMPGVTSEVSFNWEYDATRERLLGLYDKGKQKQWDAQVRIDWDQDIGLWGDKVQKAYADMGVIDFQDNDLDELSQNDEDVAEQMERLLAEQKETGTIGDDDGSRAHALAETATHAFAQSDPHALRCGEQGLLPIERPRGACSVQGQAAGER